MPLCARCTGELCGIVIAAFTFVIDGFVQLKTGYESNNIRRLWTGILFGYGLFTLFIISSAFALRYGIEAGRELVK